MVAAFLSPLSAVAVGTVTVGGQPNHPSRRPGGSRARVTNGNVRCLLSIQMCRRGIPLARSLKGHEERFLPPTLSAGCGFRKPPFAGDDQGTYAFGSRSEPRSGWPPWPREMIARFALGFVLIIQIL